MHAAAGDLRTEAKDSIRLALLGILFKSVGLPGDYTRACFQMWLRDEGTGRRGPPIHHRRRRRHSRKSSTNLYVSNLMAKAILDVRPEFAVQAADVADPAEKPVPTRPQGRFD